MAVLTVLEVDRAGEAMAYVACNAGGDQFPPDKDTFLHVKNTNAATRTVTVATPGNVLGLAVADVVVVVPATTGDVMIGPFPTEHFQQPDDGLADITYSAVTNLTIAVVKLSQP